MSKSTEVSLRRSDFPYGHIHTMAVGACRDPVACHLLMAAFDETRYAPHAGFSYFVSLNSHFPDGILLYGVFNCQIDTSVRLREDPVYATTPGLSRLCYTLLKYWHYKGWARALPRFSCSSFTSSTIFGFPMQSGHLINCGGMVLLKL